MRLAVGMLALVVLPACAQHEPMTELRISSDFSAEEIEVWIEAADDWCAVSSDTCLPVSVVDRRANVVRLRTLPGDWGNPQACAAYAEPKRGAARIEVAPDCGLSHAVALHELGHALGGQGHIEESGHLMSGTFRPDACVTERDIDHVCRGGCRDAQPTCQH